MSHRSIPELLECRCLFSAADPSGNEQQTLALINRMRQNPAAELPLLENSSDPDVQNAFKFFNVNLSVLASQWATLTPAPPLAWNTILAGTARAHDKLMMTDNSQSHQLPGEADLSTRITAAGYANFSSLRESIFIAGTSVFDAHASFAVDFGDSPTGIQNPPGHRENIMATDVSEIGIAAIHGPGTGDGTEPGPLVFTEDFGSQFNQGNPFLLGSVYIDANGDGYYTSGEGLAGIAVHISGTGGTFNTTTLSAGGYQMQVPAGTYAVSFSGGALPQGFTINNVIVGTSNVQRDATPADIFATLNAGALTILGTAQADTISVSESAGSLVADLNGVSESFPLAGVQSMLIKGLAGADTISVDPAITIPADITGNGGRDTIRGGGGSETLRGGAGINSVFAGDGDVTLIAGPGENNFVGGAGNDVFFAINGRPDVILGGSGAGVAHVDMGLDTVTGVADVLFT